MTDSIERNTKRFYAHGRSASIGPSHSNGVFALPKYSMFETSVVSFGVAVMPICVADYLLLYKPKLPLAVIEAKDNTHTVGDGMQQALEYAEALDVPFAYSSNGDGFLEHDRTGTGDVVERELPLDAFPTPAELLWDRYRKAKGITAVEEVVVTQDYYDDGSPRPCVPPRARRSARGRRRDPS